METMKLQYLKSFLQQTNEVIDKFVTAMRCASPKPMQPGTWYADPVNISEDEYVEMLVVDGLFIIELFRHSGGQTSKGLSNSKMLKRHIYQEVVLDLIILRNQLPFTILLNLIIPSDKPSHGTNIGKSGPPFFQEDDYDESGFEHLLQFLHYMLSHTFIPATNLKIRNNNLMTMKSNKELQEAGIKFQIPANANSQFNKTFQNKVMELQPLFYKNDTQKILRNFIEFEMHNEESLERLPFCHYVTFMNQLIKSEEDVHQLGLCGIIIQSVTSNDKAVLAMFNYLSESVGTNHLQSYYLEIVDSVTEHSAKRRNTWLTKLKEYFDGRWRTTSTIAAHFLFLSLGWPLGGFIGVESSHIAASDLEARFAVLEGDRFYKN
ncbi:uncharacterized protein LOC132274213 [Cornus florida]|uniref:uncharacterized protein LOC132274213 n=1 Tax=Cornus florida TaxID=4283 RepID=UPI00289DC58A|nr:uncharacterized protein LOC132274213 [Cornus florida]